jgi:uncharacterized protein YjbJ (UPF0337 family)
MTEEGGRFVDDVMQHVSGAAASANHEAKAAVDAAQDQASDAKGGAQQVCCCIFCCFCIVWMLQREVRCVKRV